MDRALMHEYDLDHGTTCMLISKFFYTLTMIEEGNLET